MMTVEPTIINKPANAVVMSYGFGSDCFASDLTADMGDHYFFVAAIRDLAGNTTYATNSTIPTVVTNGAYQYDLSGCLTNFQYRGKDYLETRGLEWNGQYQLTAVSTNGAVAERHGYDAAGRRLWTWDGTSGTNWFVYDGSQVVADLNEAGGMVRSYVWGPGIDNLLSMTSYGASTNTYYALKDHLGSVLAMTDASGNIVETYKYDAWGRTTVYGSSGGELTASAIGNRYCWQGREYSFRTGLYYFRARWYEPVTGRWLSNDPIGISGGLNQYVFCGNNPVDFRDPLGLCKSDGGDSYWRRSWRQLWYGNLTDEVTALGTGMQIVAGIFDIDLPGDVRDISADFGGWKNSWSHVGKTGLDFVGLLPVIGAAKYVDEVGALFKGGFKKLSGGEVEKLIKNDLHPHTLKPKPHSRYDLYKDPQGDVHVFPKGGTGPGEPTGININDL